MSNLPADERCEHETAMAALVDRYQQWRGYECPYCEIEQLKLDLAQQALNGQTVMEQQKEIQRLTARVKWLDEWKNACEDTIARLNRKALHPDVPEAQPCEHLRSELLAEKTRDGDPLFQMRKCLDCEKIFRVRSSLTRG